MERKDERNAYAACSICGTPIRFYAPKIGYPDLASLPLSGMFLNLLDHSKAFGHASASPHR